MSLLKSMNSCEVVNRNNEVLNGFWEYSGIYESRRRKINMEEKWLKEMIEKDKWKYIM